MPRVTYKPFMLSVIMMNVFMLNVIMLGVVAPNKLKAIFASVVRNFSFINFFCLRSVESPFCIFLSKILKKMQSCGGFVGWKLKLSSNFSCVKICKTY
jgi:hypothetical protein